MVTLKKHAVPEQTGDGVRFGKTTSPDGGVSLPALEVGDPPLHGALRRHAVSLSLTGVVRCFDVVACQFRTK